MSEPTQRDSTPLIIAVASFGLLALVGAVVLWFSAPAGLVPRAPTATPGSGAPSCTVTVTSVTRTAGGALDVDLAVSGVPAPCDRLELAHASIFAADGSSAVEAKLRAPLDSTALEPLVVRLRTEPLPPTGIERPRLKLGVMRSYATTFSKGGGEIGTTIPFPSSATAAAPR